MPMKLLSADDFRAAAKDGARPEGTVFRFATSEPEQVGDDAARTQRFVFSDATVDHAKDSIDQKGWDLSIFKRNPVALFAHMSWEPPIGRASNVGVQAGKLMGDIEFAAAEVYPFADTIYRLVKGKFLNAVSVGFLPKEWAFSSDKDRPYGIDFKSQSLLEISCCPVPCNPNALGEARAAGIDTRGLVDWAEKVLDSGEVVFLPRKDVEALRLQAKDAAPVRYYIQLTGTVSAEAAEKAREACKRWLQDPDEIIVLPPEMTLRSVGDSQDWKCGAARDLPVEADGEWDGAAAEASIFEHAGGDDFDPAVARKGFLAYDASAPKLRGSYKLPFAQLVEGELKAMASGVRAAASRLPDTDVPDTVRQAARGVLDHYEAAMTDGDKAVEALLLKIEPAEVRTAVAAALKAGRRISAATKAALAEAMGHHAAMGKCIKDLMDGDGADDGEPDGPADLDDDGGTPEPTAVGPDEPYDLSPEERRLREVRALRAKLQSDD